MSSEYKQIMKNIEKKEKAIRKGNDRSEPQSRNIGNEVMQNAHGERDNNNEQGEMNTLPTHLENLSRALKLSEKGGVGKKGNSERYIDVDQKLDRTLRCMSQKLGTDPKHRLCIPLNAMKSYEDLIEACNTYINDHHAYSLKGQERKKIVKYICNQAERDLQGIRNYMDQYSSMPEEQRVETVGELVEKVRQRKLQLADGRKKSELKQVGGGVSRLDVIKEGDLKDKNVSGYFKDEDNFTKLKGNKEILLHQMEVIRNNFPINDEIYKSIKKEIEKNTTKGTPTGILLNLLKDKNKIKDAYLKDIQVHKFIEGLKKACEGYTVTYDAIVGAFKIELKEGDSINISKRNVAASRIANLLGIGNLIAQSETAEFQDEKGNIRIGNFMQSARGIEANKAFVNIQKKGIQKKMIEDGKDEFMNDYVEKIGGKRNAVTEIDSTMLTSEFIKSLTSLQVLDNLIGQYDRHWNNFMIDQDKDGKLGHVQGIDNDFAFPHREDALDKFRELRSVYKKEDDERSLALPAMDKELAMRILMLQPQDVYLVLNDVLEKKAIDAFCARLKLMQNVIKAKRASLARENKSEDTYFLNKEEDWGKENIVNSYLEDSKNAQSTYVGQVLHDATEVGGKSAISNALIEEKEEIIAGALKSVLEFVQGPKEEKKMYFKNVIDAQLLEYLDNTEQLKTECIPEIMKELSKADKDKIYEKFIKYDRRKNPKFMFI